MKFKIDKLNYNSLPGLIEVLKQNKTEKNTRKYYHLVQKMNMLIILFSHFVFYILKIFKGNF